MQRIAALPDVPTVNESGLKGYDVILWHGLIGPKGLPQPIVERVNGELNKALKAKDMEEKLAADGVSPAGGTRAAVRRAHQARHRYLGQGGEAGGRQARVIGDVRA